MKKFILLNSPIFWDSTSEQEQYLSPLGLGYIATYLEKTDIEVEVIDCVKKKKSVQEIITWLDIESPDYIGINIFTQNYDLVKCIIENIRISCVCFIGGQAVKSIYHDILKWKSSNPLNIIIGEGEFIIPAIVLGKCDQKPEVTLNKKYVYRVNKHSLFFPKDISEIFLNRKYLGNEIIINHYNEKEAAIITSRGCMYNCAFCGGARSLNRDIPIRIRSTESIVSEIRNIISLYPDVKCIRILDDLFLRDGKSIDMANKIFSEFPQLSWRGTVHVLSLINNITKADELPQSHCRELFIGIESGSERVRKHINKRGTKQEILEVASAILKNNIDLKGYFIYGFPDETEEDFKETYDLALRIKEISMKTGGQFRTSVFQFRPYHGTELYFEIEKKGGIMHPCVFNQSISQFEGRSQFNFSFGNYSLEPDNILNDYIIKTQKLGEVHV